MKLIPLALLAFLVLPAAAVEWPDLSAPARGHGGGEKDAAVIVGLQSYAAIAPVPGAVQNAVDWHAYLTETLKVPVERVALLRDNEATLELLRERARKAAASVEPGGTLWFVFIGHGAPSKNGKDGLLVGWDAQQRPDSLYARSLGQKELLTILASGKQEKTVALIDACFSGRTPEGAPLLPGLQPLVLKLEATAAQVMPSRTVLMTAARADQFAGPLPGASRPAFSYLALGALRGWAKDGAGAATADEVLAYVKKALRAFQAAQEPELVSYKPGVTLGSGAEKGPNLAALVRGAAASAVAKTPAAPAAVPAPAPRVEPPPAAPAAPPAAQPPVARRKTPFTPGRAGIEWVRIPGGSFKMGSEEREESPIHVVTVPAFELSRAEVTFGQYAACVKDGACTPAHTSDGTCRYYEKGWQDGNLPTAFQGADQPAVCVSWQQAVDFAKWAGGELPSEAQWEYAAKSGGKDKTYPWGTESPSCNSTATMGGQGGHRGCGRNATWPVCSFPGGDTEQGLCDMAGNAEEWVTDWFYGSYEGAPVDGSALEKPDRISRVVRGGSWMYSGPTLRTTARRFREPAKREAMTGFRVARAAGAAAPARPAAAGGFRFELIGQAPDPGLLDKAAFDPQQYERRSVRLAGTADRVNLYEQKDGRAQYGFQIKSPDGRWFNVSYDVRRRGGTPIDGFTVKDGDSVDLRGVFHTQRDKAEAGKTYVGNVYVNSEVFRASDAPPR